jgi:hypothetical protein
MSTASSDNFYTYKPLPRGRYIRVLHLKPARCSAETVCCLLSDLHLPEPHRVAPVPHPNILYYGWTKAVDGEPSQHYIIDPSLNASPLLRALREKEKQPYEALSYVWGEIRGTQKIVCDNRTLLVTKNCLEALQHLRLKRKPRTLWVDSICINQKDDDEKAHQVAMMRDVYLLAKTTIAWFGRGDSEIEDVIQRSGEVSVKRPRWRVSHGCGG